MHYIIYFLQKFIKNLIFIEEEIHLLRHVKTDCVF